MTDLISHLKVLLNPLAWFLSIGKEDVEHVKAEISDLLLHSSQSLKSLLELYTVLEDIPRNNFTQQTFGPISNHCLWFFTSPEAVQQARTHCTDIKRDVSRIKFKMAKILRTENQDWKGIDKAFNRLMDADHYYQHLYEMELWRIGDELRKIDKFLSEDAADAAYDQYVELRKSLTKSCEALSNEISKMQKAQTHVHELLT
jgi:hypothetical protein